MKKILLILLGVLILSSCTSAKNDPNDFRITWTNKVDYESIDNVPHDKPVFTAKIQNLTDEVQTDIKAAAYFSGKNIKNYLMSEIYLDRLEPDGHPLSDINWTFVLTDEQIDEMYDPEDNHETMKFEFIIEE